MKHLILAAVCVLSVQGNTFAQVTVDRVPTIGTSATVTPLGGNRYDVELTTTVVAQPTTFTVKGATTDEIEDIIINANVPQVVFLNVQGPTTGQSIVSVDSIDVGSSTATVVLSLLNTSGDVGDIRIHSIIDTAIGGDVTGDVELPERNGGGLSTVSELTIAGDLFGDLIVDYGSILSVEVGGTVGTSMNPVTVRTAREIMEFVAGELHADVETGASFDVQYLETTGAGALDGDFTGSLSTRNLTQIGAGNLGMEIAGDLDASLEFTGNVTRPIDISGSLTAGNSIVIGGRLAATTGEINLGASGLEGLIIINANNTSEDWLGDITIGATTLSGPYYSNSASSLGGGSVGLVPFTFHKTDSDPDYNSSVVAPSSSPPTLVEIFHYGPVKFSLTGNQKPYTVERRPITDPPSSWTDVTSSYTFSIDTSDDRIVKVSGTFSGSLEYRIIPEDGRALCDELLTTSDVDVDYTPQDSENAFRFKVFTFDFLEMSGDDTLDQDDLDEWDKTPKDFNGDGVADQADRDLLVQAIGS